MNEDDEHEQGARYGPSTIINKQSS